MSGPFPPVMKRGLVYIFDQSDASNVGHPIRFSYTSDGIHNGGSEITQTDGTEISYNGTPGNEGAFTRVKIGLNVNEGSLNAYCLKHPGMGFNIPFIDGIQDQDEEEQTDVESDPRRMPVSDIFNEGISVTPKSLRKKKKNIDFKKTVFDSGLNRAECAIIIAYGAQLSEGLKAVLLTEILIEVLESERSIYYEVLGEYSDNDEGNPKARNE